MKREVTNQFKYILVATLIAMLLHTVEEFITKLWNFDPFMIYMSAHFQISGVVIYSIIQVLVLVLIIVVLVLAFKNRLNKSLAILLGLVFFFELLHLYNSIKILGYYPGLYTGIALIVIGYFYWRELVIIMKHKFYPLR